MKNKEIIEAFIRKFGTLKKGESDNVLLILPYMVMNLVYTLYQDYIRGVKCHHMLQKYRTIWVNEYTTLNNRFLRAFDEDQVDAVIDMMDEMEEYMAKDLMVARIAVMNVFPDEDLEMQEILSAVILANALTQCAQLYWSNSFVDKSGRRLRHPGLDKIERATKEFASHLPRKNMSRVNLNDFKDVEKSVKIVQRRLIQWVIDQNKEKEI